MNRFARLLLPLDASPASARAAECALWLAESLGATLHVLHATAHPLPAADALAHLRVRAASRARVVLHQPAGDAQAAVLAAIETHRVGLVVMSARGAARQTEADDARAIGNVACAVLERSPVPVVLLPAGHQPSLPWTSMLAAVSGEPAADDALDTAARLASALRLRVTVLHIDEGDGGTRRMGAYADAPHHEVPKRFEQLVRRGLAHCTAEQAHCVDEVLLRRGDPATVLLDEAARRGSSVITIGWRGTLGGGRAPVFTRLLHEAGSALLVVRRPDRAARARLNVGSALDGG
jgi:nucleotide-binding universal stress UspA family protein